MLRKFFFLSTLFFLLPQPLAWGGNWLEFRGSTGQGIADARHLPIQWSETENIAWKQSIPGSGWSSPVLFEGRLYLTTAVLVKDSKNQDRSLRALCLDAKSGATVWEKEVFFQDGSTAARIHHKNSHASPTPVIHERRLYLHFGHQGTACLELNGEVVWRNDRIQYVPVHGNAGSPIVVDDLLVFSCDGREKTFVIALNRKTGKKVWQTNREVSSLKKFSFCTPLLITVDGKKQIVSPGTGSVSAYRPEDGEEIWRVRYEGYSVVPRPVYGHGLVYICTGFDSPRLLAIRPDGHGDVTETHIEWNSRKGIPLTPSLLLVGDELYMVSDRGVASCLEAKTGNVHWQKRVGGKYSASPVYADGRIYLLSEDGKAVVLQAGRTFEQLAGNELHERSLASYAVDEGVLFIRTENHLYRIQSESR